MGAVSCVFRLELLTTRDNMSKLIQGSFNITMYGEIHYTDKIVPFKGDTYV